MSLADLRGRGKGAYRPDSLRLFFSLSCLIALRLSRAHLNNPSTAKSRQHPDPLNWPPPSSFSGSAPAGSSTGASTTRQFWGWGNYINEHRANTSGTLFHDSSQRLAAGNTGSFARWRCPYAARSHATTFSKLPRRQRTILPHSVRVRHANNTR